MPGGATRPPAARGPVAGSRPRARPKGDDYMDKVVLLKAMDGRVDFQGTRRECVTFVRKRAARDLRERGLM